MSIFSLAGTNMAEVWKPITEDELLDLVRAQLKECTPEQVAAFEKHRVPPYAAPITRNGARESVFVLAVKNGEALYYEDVEDGFNFSPLSPSGEILEHWCNQDELKHALWRWVPSAS